MSKVKIKDIPLCDCNTCNVYSGGCGGRGPAVYSVIRNGKRMKLCTRCDLSSDKPTKKLLPNVKNYPAKHMIDFDPLGAFCIDFSVSKSKTK